MSILLSSHFKGLFWSRVIKLFILIIFNFKTITVIIFLQIHSRVAMTYNVIYIALKKIPVFLILKIQVIR